ncbi:unnamed protein product [Eretmochelys imbricata]
MGTEPVSPGSAAPAQPQGPGTAGLRGLALGTEPVTHGAAVAAELETIPQQRQAGGSGDGVGVQSAPWLPTPSSAPGSCSLPFRAPGWGGSSCVLGGWNRDSQTPLPPCPRDSGSAPRPARYQPLWPCWGSPCAGTSPIRGGSRKWRSCTSRSGETPCTSLSGRKSCCRHWGPGPWCRRTRPSTSRDRRLPLVTLQPVPWASSRLEMGRPLGACSPLRRCPRVSAGRAPLPSGCPEVPAPG